MDNDRYQIVVEKSWGALERKVNTLMKIGWKPQGGVIYADATDDNIAKGGKYGKCIQGMTKKEEL